MGQSFAPMTLLVLAASDDLAAAFKEDHFRSALLYRRPLVAWLRLPANENVE